MNRPTQTHGARPMGASDARTLALATPPITGPLLDQWITGQRAFLAVLEEAGPAGADRLAAAHGRALAASGLDAQVFAQVESVVRNFCGILTTAQVLDRKVAQLEGSVDEADERARIASERDRLLALTPLRQRHGDEAVETLRAASSELMDLHARLHRAMPR